MSRSAIPPRDRLIVALDVPSAEAAEALVERLGDEVSFYKVGLELAMADGYWRLIERLGGLGKRVFADLKLFDVPATVERAVGRIAERGGIDFLTVHGNDAILQAACRAGGGSRGLQILAVTVLTSLDRGDLDDLGFPAVDVERLVVSRARRAVELGCAGVVASGHEAAALRRALGDGFLVVVPGIRPVDNRDRRTDDQKRTVDVEEAFAAGADHIVVGRPIRDAADPRAAAAAIQARIAAHFAPA